MKILMVVNKFEREQEILSKIANMILALHPDSCVESIQVFKKGFVSDIIDFSPDILFTFPFTAYPVASTFYILKHLLNCFIVCFRTEGILDFSSEKHLNGAVGLDKYGENLVDYELVWGEDAAQFLSRGLLRQGKISSRDRVKSFGYPNYEVYFENQQKEAPELPEKVASRIHGYDREKVLFFVTGFTLADYSEEDLIRAGDLFDVNDKQNFNRELERLRNLARASDMMRDQWIKHILQIAERHKELLIIVKSHPTENLLNERLGIDPYGRLNDQGNVVYIEEPARVVDLMRVSGLFFHYGSTTAAESYFLGVPSVLISSNGLFDEYGWTSTRKIGISELKDLVDEHCCAPLQFEMTPWIQDRLRGAFNIRPEHLTGLSAYTPTEDIARFLVGLGQDSPQVVDTADPYLLQAFRMRGKGLLLELLMRAFSNLPGRILNRSKACMDAATEVARFYLKALISRASSG